MHMFGDCVGVVGNTAVTTGDHDGFAVEGVFECTNYVCKKEVSGLPDQQLDRRAFERMQFLDARRPTRKFFAFNVTNFGIRKHAPCRDRADRGDERFASEKTNPCFEVSARMAKAFSNDPTLMLDECAKRCGIAYESGKPKRLVQNDAC